MAKVLMTRRSLLIAAPAVILTPKLLMPIRPWAAPAFLGNKFYFETIISHDTLWEVTESGSWAVGNMFAGGRWWKQRV